MPTDRLARLRSWPSGVYTDELARLWRAGHPQRTTTLDVPSGASPASPQRVAVICHVYYPELLDEVEAVLRNLPAATDLYVSVVRAEDRDTVTDRLSAWSSGVLDVRVVENRGRDIAPKYVAFADVYERGYDLLLFLHTKRSTYEHVGTPWRQYLFASLAGSRDRVQGVLALFAADPGLGVLAPRHFEAVAGDTIWQGTFLQASRLAKRMGVRVRRWAPPDFASGSMFWCRPAALRSITALHLRLEDFPPEARQVTATNMHALERLLFVAAEQAGFRAGLLRASEEEAAAAGPPEPAAADARPPLGMWLRALPPTVRRMAADAEIRRKRFSPARLLPRLVRRLRPTRSPV